MRLLAASILVPAAAALAGCGGSKVTATTTVMPSTLQQTATAGSTTAGSARTLLVTVGPHGVAGGPEKFTVPKGQRVVLVVRSALADEVHVHGYDLHGDVAKNGVVRIPFKASIAGQFDVELESRSLPIASLEVR